MARPTLIAAAETPGPVFGLASIGGDGASAALQADREVNRLRQQPGATQPGTPAFQAMVRQFSKSPLSGVTTVTALALRKSGWEPRTPGAAGNKQASVDYGTNIGRAPFFTLTSASQSVSVGSDDDAWTVVHLMAQALSLFVPGTASFVENVITVSGDSVQLAIVLYAPDTDASSVAVKQSIFAFGTAQWPSFAEKVAGIQVTCADEWVGLMASPRQG
jgi:hypothetical protein